ncbi:hypothetical protein [Duganella vulcania]|nr:hypothetical protein [Duganella vulcania]
MDITLLTPQGGFTYAVFNKLPIQEAISNPLEINDLEASAL